MAISIMNGLAAMGQGLAQSAQAYGLEMQKADMQRQAMMLADQLATVRESAGRQEAGRIEEAHTKLSDTLTGARESAGRQEAARIAAAAAEREYQFKGGEAATQRQFQTGQTTAEQQFRAGESALTRESEEKRTGMTTGATISAAQARAQATLDAGKLSNQARIDAANIAAGGYNYTPTTQPDPDNPGKTISGVLKTPRRGDEPPVFVPTGTDPNKPGAGGLGNRAEVYFNRVVTAGAEAAAAAKNIMELPASSSRGVFGGRTQGGGLMQAAKETLTNSLTTQEVQDYNVMIAGVARSLASIEAAGLAPTGAFTQSMDAVVLKEGDSEITKMRKMAEIRQIVEKGLEANLVNPRIPEEQKNKVREIIGAMQTAIPFTHHDITMLQKSTTPGQTMNDLVKTKGLTAMPGAEAPTTWNHTAVNSKGEQIHSNDGKTWFLPDGKPYSP